MKPSNKNLAMQLKAQSKTVKSMKTVTSKQSEKPLKPSTEAWMLQTLQHGKRMSQDENYRQLVAKSLS
jgi:hypothetical protein